MTITVYTFQAAYVCGDCARSALLKLAMADRDDSSGPDADRLSGFSAMSTDDLCDYAHRRAGLSIGHATDTDRIPAPVDEHEEHEGPEWCDACHVLLPVRLTDEGHRTLARTVADAVDAGRIPEALAAAAWHYGISTEGADRLAMADDPARFLAFLQGIGACHEARIWCHRKGLRQAWAECPNARADWMEFLLVTGFGLDPSHEIHNASADGLRRLFPDVVTLKRAENVEPERKAGPLDVLASTFSFGCSPANNRDVRAYRFRIASGQHVHHGTYTGPHAPSCADVLACMLLDASTLDNATDVADWIAECNGMPTDADGLRKALASHAECCREREFLRATVADLPAAIDAAGEL